MKQEYGFHLRYVWSWGYCFVSLRKPTRCKVLKNAVPLVRRCQTWTRRGFLPWNQQLIYFDKYGSLVCRVMRLRNSSFAPCSTPTYFDALHELFAWRFSSGWRRSGRMECGILKIFGKISLITIQTPMNKSQRNKKETSKVLSLQRKFSMRKMCRKWNI